MIENEDDIIDNASIGTVFKVKHDDKYYALKSIKISIEEVKEFNELINKGFTLDNTELHIARDIYFCNWLKENIDSTNIKHFVILYKYGLYNKSTYEKKITDGIKAIPEVLKRYEKVYNSKYTLQYLMDLKMGSHYSIGDKLNKKETLSLLIQILFALYLMHRDGFYQVDVNRGNLCYAKTDEEYINILSLKIPTFGYIWSLIDYTEILSNKFVLNKNEKKILTFRNLRHEDNLTLLYIILSRNMLDPINKIINNEHLTPQEMELFNDKCFDYYDTIVYCQHTTNEPYLINYIYNNLLKIIE